MRDNLGLAGDLVGDVVGHHLGCSFSLHLGELSRADHNVIYLDPLCRVGSRFYSLGRDDGVVAVAADRAAYGHLAGVFPCVAAWTSNHNFPHF